jgi:PRC-barrel domain protein
MLNVEQIEEWLGQEVVDSEGERVGKLEEVFYSSAGGEAIFASVKSGLLGRHSSLVPLAGASVGRDYVRLAYTGEQIESADSEVSFKGANLGRDDARRFGELYGVDVGPEEYFEAATVINERALEADEARKGAEELEREAQRREAEAEQAQGTAQGAEQTAAEKAEAAEQARAEAERARAEADRIDPP